MGHTVDSIREDKLRYLQEYRIKNRDALKIKRAAKVAADPEKYAAIAAKSYDKHSKERKAESNAAYASKRDQVSAKQKAAYAADPRKFADKSYRKKYGITLAQVLEMFDAAEDQCQCCSRNIARPGDRSARSAIGHVDHCHDTGRVRGVLCSPCNTALGLLRDMPHLAVSYLEKTA